MKIGKFASIFLLIALSSPLQAGVWAQEAMAHTSVPASEPQNLGLLKDKLKAYRDCCYAAGLAQQDQVALAYLERRAAHKRPSERLALVLDIDETSLSNYPEELKDDFGFIQKDWNAWAESEKAAAIPGTLKLSRRAQQLGVAVFFITGRADTLRDVTAKNLMAAGYSNWAGLTLRSQSELHEATIAYKSAARARIAQQGYKIILSVGDQWSDLKGFPQAEFNVKLPNPFYYIP
jgi:5'-nucleotidase (lipoprotein e(P4) family)